MRSSPAARWPLDVRPIARRRGWDVEVVPVDALLHNRPEQIAPAVRLAPARAPRRRRPRLRRLRHPRRADGLGLPRLEGDHCYDVFAREEVATPSAEEPGTYFLTDFLARTFEHTVVRELGLDRYPELRDDYFRNYTRVLWLAQRPTPATRACAERAAASARPAARSSGPSGIVGLERELERLLAAAASPSRADRPELAVDRLVEERGHIDHAHSSPAPWTPSSSITVQNGHATASVSAPVATASRTRFSLIGLPRSSIHMWAPPAPQQNVCLPLRSISTGSPTAATSSRGGASTSLWRAR